MDKAAFIQAVTYYGSQLSRWPTQIRIAAEQAMLNNTEWQQILANEQDFEQQMASAPLPSYPPARVHDIIRQAASLPQQRLATISPFKALMPLAACLALLFSGMATTALTTQGLEIDPLFIIEDTVWHD